jgi:CBS domain-containing protein
VAQTVEEIMTRNPRTVDAGDSVLEAARQMRDGDFGSVIVMRDGRVDGIVTDRDIAVRAVAEGRDPESTQVSEVSTSGVATIEPGQSIDDAVEAMREHDIRRLPVVEDGRPVGILSLGDLAVERDPQSVLADISASSPDQ